MKLLAVKTQSAVNGVKTSLYDADFIFEPNDKFERFLTIGERFSGDFQIATAIRKPQRDPISTNTCFCRSLAARPLF